MKKGFILLETLIVLAIFSTVFPVFFNLLFHEIKVNQTYSQSVNIEQQLIFVEEYLQNLASKATSFSVVNNKLYITTKDKSYEIGYRKKSVYVKQKAYRYLTVKPIVVKSLDIIQTNPRLVAIHIHMANIDRNLLLVFN